MEYNFINVSWTEPWTSDLAPVKGYMVQLLRGGEVEENETITGNSRLTYLFEGLTHTTPYMVRVAAVNDVGLGPFGTVQQTTPLPDGGLCVCVCACVRARVCVCVCVCVRMDT